MLKYYEDNERNFFFEIYQFEMVFVLIRQT